MSTALERGLSILEHLAAHPAGLPLALLATELDLPLSGCHRLLGELLRRGYVRQLRPQGDYLLTTKIVSLGLGYLSGAGIVDIAEPLLERLATASGELVRLSIVDDDRLTWVAKAQGMRKGLRYDPDMGMVAHLSCTASGHAWLLTMSDERAMELVSRQGFGSPEVYGPKAPTTVKALLGFLHAACCTRQGLLDDRRSVCARHDGHCCACDAAQGGHRRHQHRRSAHPAHQGAHVRPCAGVACGCGRTRAH